MRMIERLSAAVQNETGHRSDGWQNVILGLGGTKDPSAYTTFARHGQLADELLEAVYTEDHFAAKVIEAIVRDGVRPGWALRIPGNITRSTNAAKRYKAREDELGVAQHLQFGANMGRLFGGAITWIGAEDGRPPDTLLRDDAIRTIRFLHTFDRRDVRIARYYADPRHPKYRQPELYEIRPRTIIGAGALTRIATSIIGARVVLVHESRVVRWNGQPTTDERRRELQGWDDSILERCWEALKQLAEDYGAKSLFLGRLSQAVYKIKDLYGMLAGNREEVLTKRMTLLDQSRSRARAILLDKEEDFLNVQQPMTGLESILDRSVLRLAAAADMPVTILMGQSPAGFDSTGEGDLEVWSTRVDAWRQTELRPRHEMITRQILLAQDGPRSSLGEPNEWELHYKPLRMPTPAEQADLDLKRAQTDAINIDKGIYPAEVAAFRYARETERIELEEGELKEALQRRKDLRNQPPKDNAELGTVGARSSAAIEILEKVNAKTLARESGLALLVELFRFTPEVAEKILGPKDFEAAKPPAPPIPPQGNGAGAGNPPAPPNGEGAGAPQGLPGVNDGGAREPGPPPP